MTTDILDLLPMTDTNSLSTLTPISEEKKVKSVFDLIEQTTGHTVKAMTIDEYQQNRADMLNAMKGGLSGGNCDMCLNKGAVYSVKNGEVVSSECECMTKRRSIWEMRVSGLGDLLDTCDFDNYIAIEPWQIRVRDTLKNYSETDGGKWLYVGGQNGAGKTHLCTAVCKRLMERGYSVRYMLWKDIYRKTLALKFKEEEYEKFIREIKAVEVLYIDDFLKVGRGAAQGGLSESEIAAAYEIINSRYLQRSPRKRTIISAEYYIDELSKFDIAMAGRIKERCGGLTTQVKRDPARDHRQRAKTPQNQAI